MALPDLPDYSNLLQSLNWNVSSGMGQNYGYNLLNSGLNNDVVPIGDTGDNLGYNLSGTEPVWSDTEPPYRPGFISYQFGDRWMTYPDPNYDPNETGGPAVSPNIDESLYTPPPTSPPDTSSDPTFPPSEPPPPTTTPPILPPEDDTENWPERPTLNLPEFTPRDATYTPPTYLAPTLATLPTFNAPEYDPYGTGNVKQRTQDLIKTGVRDLENAVRQSLSGDIENPNVRRNVERSALSGYSLGLEDISSAARGRALNEYTDDYSRAYTTAEKNYETTVNQTGLSNAAKQQESQINYQRDLQTYNQQWQREEDEAMTNYLTQQQALINNFLADLKAYELETGTTVHIITEED